MEKCSGTHEDDAVPAAAARARPMPVLPAVGSMMVPPGRSSPRCSASRIIQAPIRSFTLPPGLYHSSLA